MLAPIHQRHTDSSGRCILRGRAEVVIFRDFVGDGELIAALAAFLVTGEPFIGLGLACGRGILNFAACSMGEQ